MIYVTLEKKDEQACSLNLLGSDSILTPNLDKLLQDYDLSYEDKFTLDYSQILISLAKDNFIPVSETFFYKV